MRSSASIGLHDRALHLHNDAQQFASEALRGARQLHTPLAHGQQASAAKRLLAAAGLATGAAACYATAQRTATCESAAAAKTRFDADGFGSPSFKGDVVIVTGGTTGIGAACCAHMAKAGGVVYNIDFKAPAAEVAGVTHLQCDVSDVAQVKRAVGAVVKAHGRIDCLVSNAGVWHGGDFEKTSERDFDKVVGVNLKGTFFGIQAAVPAMLDNGGSIVIIGSDQSLIGKPEQHLYGCTKGAIAQLSKSLAAHYAPKGVRVNCICPGTIDTPLMHGAVQDFVKQKGANAEELYTWLETAQPLPRLGRPEEVAALVACVAKIPFCVGSMISVDGGYTAQ